ncbi:MAG TPA: PQQ-dependent sugar dehydrogenase [Longimicrobiaceae bacterium]|nr:PQQ-dependent sugar dehydrogenase [Longimicrobiaceae bacterium]
MEMPGIRGGKRLRSALFMLAVLAACSDVNRPVEVATVEVVAPTTTLEVGTTLQLSATPRAADGAELSQVAVEWSTGDAAVAGVTPDGLVTGTAPGTVDIQASAGGRTGTVTLTVVPVPVVSLEVAPDTATLLVGDTRRLAATPRDAAGAELAGRAITWTSDDAEVASVAGDGTVTARSAGTATITAESEGVKATARVTVVAPLVPALTVQEYASGFPTPSHVAWRPGDDRMFVVSVYGQVTAVRGGSKLPGYFLDISDKVSRDREQGMFSLAFHPRFASNGYFYVNYTDLEGNLRIERYTVSANPDRADPASAKLILHVAHPPVPEHYGGELAFGPDGMLYVGVGDGGHGYDHNAQDRGTLLGKILRIDVDAGDPYAIPADNPFVGEAGARGEIWALGLRNPWRMSFDLETGLLYVADVGEVGWEEVNVVPAGQGGLNFGWPRLEGSHCYPSGATGCDRSGMVLPVLEYPHSAAPGETGTQHPTGCAVTGGYVYRGSLIPGLRGHYFYGDLCKGWVGSFRFRDGKATEQRQWSFGNMAFLVTLGRDAAGEMYVLPYSGVVYRIVPAEGGAQRRF